MLSWSGVANSGALNLPDASLLVDQIVATLEQIGGFIFDLPPILGRRWLSSPLPSAIQLIQLIWTYSSTLSSGQCPQGVY
jgi:hypothetical protein